ncbi:MAG: type II toxin-antitoxin system VapC family toxin [Candidatus Omnitrophica bacterium]|nr:type II toxin-antitoxin system VapC family toxin [Candidatus Omnitrophota bacterium]MBU1047916.1 type II toxin-antitoxin system VapC family toxin [Candidatus Omnitrophota bacterium]MBU1631080.1 type II toxin-antitoxin system VapC family toxin [Candidatus Omnitrophota bacterium]MBU1766970.1 type II toxin-antitoxin system VapC family toxin [Candidatus Omnitrophota bacterium]MBU1889347.1 type II toxin-antitoxin system VapC family toxin [Candidatus Omnitrophota bacterium]
MTSILDSHGLLAFLEKEPGFEKVESLFVNAVAKDKDLLMTSVNWGEVYYIVLRECGAEKAQEIERVIKTLPIEIIDVDITLAKQAAYFKATKKLSYADCFAAALAKQHKGEVVTGDKEFKAVEDEVRIAWII